MATSDTIHTPPVECYGHPIDPKTEVLIDHVRLEHPDIILIVHESPADVPQEELPY